MDFTTGPRKWCQGVAAGVVLGLSLSTTAFAGQRTLGTSGWEARWASSLDSYVDIVVDSETADAVFIEKSSEFIQGQGPGGFPAIPIVFRQISWPAVSQIVIQDGIITNSTGEAWTDFRFNVLDSGDAWFNKAKSDASANNTGFNTTPFNNQVWGDPNPGNPDQVMSFGLDGFGLGPGGSDAKIADGDIWFPGNGVGDGELFIDVTPKAVRPYTILVFTETPAPEPTTIMLLGLGGLLLRRHRVA